MSKSFNRVLLTTAALGLMATSANAQVPNSVRPENFQKQNTIMDQRPEVGGAPVIKDSGVKAKKTGSSTRFVLKGIKLEGSTVYSEDKLRPLYADKLGQKITLDDLNQIAADITTYYRNNGYILTRAVVPPQHANNGVFTVRVVEGYVNDVRLTGDVGKGGDDLLQAYASKIKNAKPLNAETLERYLLLMEDLPGVDARAVLTPAATATGASDVIVTITRRPVEASVGLDNRGSRFLGPEQLSGSLFLNNLIGRDDMTAVRASNTIFHKGELLFGELRHSEPVGSEGTTVTVAASKVHTNPGDNLKGLDIKGDSGAFSLNVTHPIERSRRTNWFVTGDMTARDVEVTTLGTSLYKDKTRVLTLGSSYDFVDGWAGINKAEANVGHGFNWDTSKGVNARSRSNGETDFTKFNAKASRIQPITGPFSLYGAASGQYSHDPLLASEEFTVGGSEFGSAYDTAEISGDSGVAARAELQFNQAPSNWLNQYQLYTFYDMGKVWNRNALATEKKEDWLSSAGLGARFTVLDNVTGGIEGAVPLTRNVAAKNNAGDEPRLFFNLQYRY